MLTSISCESLFKSSEYLFESEKDLEFDFSAAKAALAPKFTITSLSKLALAFVLISWLPSSKSPLALKFDLAAKVDPMRASKQI